MKDVNLNIMLEYDKKIANIENKVKYLESVLDSINSTDVDESLKNKLDYKNSPFYANYDGKVFDSIANKKNNLVLKSIIESIPFPVFIKDETSTYRMVNALEAKLFALSEKDIIGKKDEHFIKDEDELHLIRETDEKVLKTKTAIELPEQSFSLPSGSSYSFKTHKIPFFNPITGQTNILGFSMDVTDSIQLNHLKKIVLLCSNPLL